jgi:hypothetical protein
MNSEIANPAEKDACTRPAWVDVMPHSRVRVARLAA